jgi:diacylglycerol kinase (ATP)
MSKSRTHIILNPASRGGKTRAKGAEILRLIEHQLGDALSLHITQSRLDATHSAAEAIRQGCELIVTIGGDGTIQEVVNGFFSNGHLINPDCRLGIINCGTGHGFAQSLALPRSIESQVELLSRGRCRPVDLGRVRYQNERGKTCYRYFVNECQLGIGASVVERVQGNQKRLGGSIAFGLGVVQTVFRHKSQSMTLILDEKETITGSLTGVVVANGAFTGGGMNLAPTARIDDGTLKVLVMYDLSLAQRLLNFPKIYFGTHLSSSLFGYHEARSLKICSEETVFVEADGETLGTTPCSVDIIPSAVKVQSISLNGA